eukprot:gene31735-38356_t
MAGVMGGLISTVALYPLELIKTRMQVMHEADKAYLSMRHAARKVFVNEGIYGLYRGVVPAAVAASGSWGGYFYFYELSKQRKLLHKSTYQNSHQSSLDTVDHLLSGVEAGVAMVFLFNPVWVVKTRLALQGAETHITGKKYKGLSDALRLIYREEGLAGLYTGLVPALLLTSHGAIQFAIYERMKTLAFALYHGSEQPAWVSLILGGGSKIVASTATYPYQVIKSRLQQRQDSESTRYKGTMDCIRRIWRADGWVGFFRGCIPNALKVAPGSALTFVVYEECMKLFKSTDKGSEVANIATITEE